MNGQTNGIKRFRKARITHALELVAEFLRVMSACIMAVSGINLVKYMIRHQRETSAPYANPPPTTTQTG